MRDHRLNTLGQIISAHRKDGSHWFDTSTLRWFRARVSEMVYPTFSTEHGTYFVSSEKGPDDVRRYSVRHAVLILDADGNVTGCTIDTVGEFQAYASRNGAHAAAKRFRAVHMIPRDDSN